MRRAFVLQNTRLQRPPHVPELQLYLADEVMPIWRMTEQELGEAGVPPPFWAFAWPGGQAIARYLLDHPEEVAGKRVLDVGTGSGLCAIAAMKAGAASALAADIDVFCEEAVALNARANGVSVAFTNRDLLDAHAPGTRRAKPAWVSPRAAPKPAEPAGYPAWVSDLILAGDLCYEQPLAGRILAWLQAAHAQGTRVLIGDPGRDYFSGEGMVRLVTYQVPTTRELEDREVKQTGVFTFGTKGDFTRKNPASSAGFEEEGRVLSVSVTGNTKPVTACRVPLRALVPSLCLMFCLLCLQNGVV